MHEHTYLIVGWRHAAAIVSHLQQLTAVLLQPDLRRAVVRGDQWEAEQQGRLGAGKPPRHVSFHPPHPRRAWQRPLCTQPAAAARTSTLVAPASSAFSTSSFTAVARSRMTCKQVGEGRGEERAWVCASHVGLARKRGGGARESAKHALHPRAPNRASRAREAGPGVQATHLPCADAVHRRRVDGPNLASAAAAPLLLLPWLLLLLHLLLRRLLRLLLVGCLIRTWLLACCRRSRCGCCCRLLLLGKTCWRRRRGARSRRSRKRGKASKGSAPPAFARHGANGEPLAADRCRCG